MLAGRLLALVLVLVLVLVLNAGRGWLAGSFSGLIECWAAVNTCSSSYVGMV
jgi:hypothetical protein